ncbi:MAG TPA: UDP-N-acetylmuramate:L-alanyl-gamma-D-glutamyl-meso-diaminopimelate ligase [Oceanospirillales bacterium]|nr:UDP-N-acetylmuramate:L-alanyl-gamma-D-glutamyl-meso-diaminopimelate ligase [Oceanospirillales bacterium]
MKIHILGICGTFMGGLAVLAKSLGYDVSGSDKNVYPPMSTQLQALGISMHNGYADDVLATPYDEVVVGNVMTRGMPVIETLLRGSQKFSSGPQWLGERLLRHKKVFSVAGTHGKTSTSSMLAWILESHNKNPGFLIGGVAEDFGISARNTDSRCFVIEADEYDSAFFDKRSKFVHYHSDVLILNNLEYDHADIFVDLDAIKTQFHHLVRTIADNGCIVYNHEDKNLRDVLDRGCWTPSISFGADQGADIWAASRSSDYSQFDVYYQDQLCARVRWNLTGRHNMFNAMAAMAAAMQEGVSLKQSAQSLNDFNGIKRRMEFIGQAQGVQIFDDFAHHPTAIATTINGIKHKLADNNQGEKLIVVFEPRSNSMRLGTHALDLPAALKGADSAFVMNYPQLQWQGSAIKQLAASGVNLPESVEQLLEQLGQLCTAGSHVVFMSNGSFAQAPLRFLQALKAK